LCTLGDEWFRELCTCSLGEVRYGKLWLLFGKLIPFSRNFLLAD
jgi:hypothetical protein